MYLLKYTFILYMYSDLLYIFAICKHIYKLWRVMWLLLQYRKRNTEKALKTAKVICIAGFFWQRASLLQEFLICKPKLWHPFGRWHMVPIGTGYCISSFSLVQDLRKVLVVGIWNLNPSTLRLFNWTPNFNPNLVKQTSTQCCIWILGLPQKYRDKLSYSPSQ